MDSTYKAGERPMDCTTDTQTVEELLGIPLESVKSISIWFLSQFGDTKRTCVMFAK